MAVPPSIPVIDISPFFTHSEDEEVVFHDWDRAFREFGFAIVVGHGISPARMLDVETAMDDFFSLPKEAKVLWTHGRYGVADGGYSGLNTEAVAQSHDGAAKGAAAADPVESFAFPFPPRFFRPPFSTPSSSVVEHLITAAGAYYTECERLLSILHQISARALSLHDDDHINAFYNFDDGVGEITAFNRSSFSNALKLSFYPYGTQIRGDPAERDEREEMRYGQHTDFSGFTILRPDPNDWKSIQDGGLEVQHPRSGLWHPVRLPEENKTALVINAGDLISRWTDDRWYPTTYPSAL